MGDQMKVTDLDAKKIIHFMVSVEKLHFSVNLSCATMFACALLVDSGRLWQISEFIKPIIIITISNASK